MEVPNVFAFASGILLGIIHFSSKRPKFPDGTNRYGITSYAVGIFVTYLILDILPRVSEADIHLAEKSVYKHADQFFITLKHSLLDQS